MILLRGVSRVKKEPDGCTWNESLACIVPQGKGWITWAIKMKDWNCKALRCCALSLPEESREVGECGPHTSVLGLHGRRLCPREQGPRTSRCCCSLPGRVPGTAVRTPPALGTKGWWHSPPVSGCHEDWFITVSATITEPSKEAVEVVYSQC